MRLLTKKISLPLLVAMLLTISQTTLSAEDPYKKYAGTQLNVLFPDIGHHNVVETIIPEFTKETGIRVKVEKQRYLQARKTQAAALKKAVGPYDIISYVVMDKGPLGLSGGLLPLGIMFAQGGLVDPEYDILDFIPAYVENIGIVGGNKGYLPGPSSLLVGLPFGAETSALAYRKDILQKHNISPPENYSELLDAMCKISQNEPGMHGLASRGATGHQMTHAFLLHLAPFGGRIFDQKWNPIFNQSNGLRALKILKEIADCGHPNMQNFGATDAQAAFRNGETAFYLDTTIAAGSFEDPAASKIAGKVGWAIHPTGVRRGSQSGGFGIGIPANTQHREAAFLFLQWLTSKKIDKKITAAGGSPIRTSTMLNSELNRNRPYLKTFKRALDFSDSNWRPLIPEWDLINSPILGKGIHSVIFSGADPQTTLDAMAEEVRKIMDDAGYYNFKRS